MPDFSNDEAWERDAHPETVSAVVVSILALVEPSADSDRTEVLTQYLANRDYTDAELRYAARELPRDEHLDAKMRYGKPLTPADFERVINRSRRIRTSLRTAMDRETMIEMIEEFDDLSEDDFGQRHDQNNNTVFLLKKEARQRIESNE